MGATKPCNPFSFASCVKCSLTTEGKFEENGGFAAEYLSLTRCRDECSGKMLQTHSLLRRWIQENNEHVDKWKVCTQWNTLAFYRLKLAFYNKSV